MQQRQNQLDAYLLQGLTNTSRQVVSETLNIMGLNWMIQTTATEQMLAAQLGISSVYHHRFGRMAQESGHGYYVDVYMGITGNVSRSGKDTANDNLTSQYFDLFTYFDSALEHGIIEQLQSSNLVASSTMKMLQIAITNGQAVYLGSSTNWTTVKSKLKNYDANTLAKFDTNINAGAYLLLPQNGSNHISGNTSWAGYGCVSRIATTTNKAVGMLISGGYFGGYAPYSGITPDYWTIQNYFDAQPSAVNAAPTTAYNPHTGDPVDTANGTFVIESTDLSLGQTEPRGISLNRSYNSRRRNMNPAGMAGGWTHNYAASADECPAPQAGLGGTTPAQMAPMLVATCAAISLYNGNQPDPKNWTVSALIAKWGIDQLAKNGISFSLGKDTLQFVKQPDGSFTPPANSTWTLTNLNSAYNLQQRHGNAFKFDSFGRLTNIVDQYSQG